MHVEEPSGSGADAKGARASIHAAKLVWIPVQTQRGLHRVTLVASDGRGRDALDIDIVVEERWESWFLPGAQYVAYFPAGAGEGAFHGPSFELVIGSWVHDTRDRGPSHGRIYLDVALLDATHADRSVGVSYAAHESPTQNSSTMSFGSKPSASTDP